MSINERDLYRSVGERLKERRQAIEITQTELAEAVGIFRTSVTNIEAGRQRAPLHLLYSLCVALNIELTSILPENGTVMEPSSVEITVGEETRMVPPKAAGVLHKLLQGPVSSGQGGTL